jgi:cytolysin (calcineurin-like family phosphatase)
LLVCLTFFLSVAGALAAADFSGTWQFSVDLDNDAGHGDPAFVLKQDGGKLTGSYNGPLGEYPVTGTVTGDTATFGFELKRDDLTLKAVYTGTLAGAGKMNGTVRFEPEGPTGKWTATRK